MLQYRILGLKHRTNGYTRPRYWHRLVGLPAHTIGGLVASPVYTQGGSSAKPLFDDVVSTFDYGSIMSNINTLV